MAWRWLAFAAGIGILLSTWFSVIGTLVVTRGVSSRIARLSGRAVTGLFRLVTARVRTYTRLDRILAWQAGIALLVRLSLWLGLLVVGYALVLIPFVHGQIGDAFNESGSSMFTLGYAAPH